MPNSNYSPRYLLSRQNALASLLAERVLADPERAIAIVKANLKRWMPSMDQRSLPIIEPWIEASSNAASLACLLVEPGERGDLLRSMAPFAGVLSVEERTSFLRDYAIHAHDA
jgi:hypothetical protein